jgi:uncharacterized membrane protein YcaP (DUF421 family)
MDTVIRAVIVYFALWILIRLSGRRTIGELSAFDLILFLVIGGATQRALVGQDYSLTTAFIIVCTLIAIDAGLSLIRRDSKTVAHVLDGVPMILVEHGQPLRARMQRARVTIEDVLVAARHMHGLERIDQVRFAILEASGDISIIPDTPRPAG